jgi:DNA-binding response OmpR family regulator
LLEILWEHKGKIVTREEVIAAVWPESDEAGITEQAIDALVRRLRDRLAEVDPDHEYLVTVRGLGSDWTIDLEAMSNDKRNRVLRAD